MKVQSNYPNQQDLICLSHLRWNFVFQRPQHLMSRFAKARRVFFVEEPVFQAVGEPFLQVEHCPQTKVQVVTPHLSSEANRNQVLSHLLQQFALTHEITNPVVWFYTPMALEFFPESITPSAVIYDCMDELSLFRGAPVQLLSREAELLEMADLVFTGGVSLFEAKRNRHPRVYAFPSGVDVHHFQQARSLPADFREQGSMPPPRFAYAGVIDERIDLPLLD